MPTDKKCPRCKSDALYKFGKTKNGKQRYQCQVCNRQFVLGKTRLEVKKRPACPGCGKPMHIYMRTDAYVRFRCSNYPICKTFHKLTKDDVLVHQFFDSWDLAHLKTKSYPLVILPPHIFSWSAIQSCLHFKHLWNSLIFTIQLCALNVPNYII